MNHQDKTPIRAIVTLYDKTVIIKQIEYEYEDGSISEKLPRIIHTGMFMDTVLFGEHLTIRFYLFCNAISLYRSDVNEMTFISERTRPCSIHCFGQDHQLMPGEHVTIIKPMQEADSEI